MMALMITLVPHIVMSVLMFAIPHLTRREVLFGLVVPPDFRSQPEARSAIRSFRLAVAIPALIGAVSIPLLISRFVAVGILAPMITIAAGFTSFVMQNRRLARFAVTPEPIRELELSDEPERLPWFAWLGFAPLLFLGAVAMYLHANWDRIPERRPVHWGLDGQPNRWVDRSVQGVYGPLILAAEMMLWLFGFALAIWYGSRRSEPLRKPALTVFLVLQWVLAVTIPGSALQSMLGIPVQVLVAVPIAIIAFTVVYLIKKNRQSIGPVDPTPRECWKGGILYYNPNDPVLFVGRRDGAGFTLNIANPWSWVVIGSPLLILGLQALTMH
jgi:uncharacterized membrane protein